MQTNVKKNWRTKNAEYRCGDNLVQTHQVFQVNYILNLRRMVRSIARTKQ